MTARSAIELTAFEQIEAGVGTVLLRVTGTTSEELGAGTRPSLLLVDGDDTHHLSALPAPPDPSGVLRAAYPVSASLIGPSTAFALAFDDGTRVELPGPAARAGRSRSSERESESRPRAIEDLQRRLQSERSQRAALEVAAADRAAQLRGVQAEFAEHVEHAASITSALQASADIAVAEAAQCRADADRVRVQLEQAQTAAAGAERRAADHAEEIERLQQELQRMSERVGRLDAALATAQTDAREAHEIADGLRMQLLQQTETATASSAELEALVEIANAEATRHLDRAEWQEGEISRLRAQLERPDDRADQSNAASEPASSIEAQLGEARGVAGSLAAELDEAEIRADTLAEVVRAETARREDTERELQMARQEIDTLRHELERAQLEAEVQLRRPATAATDERTAESEGADVPASEDPTELSHAAPTAQPAAALAAPPPDTRMSNLTPPATPAHAAGASGATSHRVRGAVQTLPAEVTAGLLLFVLGIIIAILVLSGQLG